MSLRLTPAIKFLLIACGAGFLIQQTADQFFGGNVLSWLALVPAGVVLEHRFWQLITYVFLHGDVMHLFLNAMMLVFIGGEIEGLWGSRRVLLYFFFCSVMAGVTYLFLQVFIWGAEGLHVPMLGASGGIYGLLLAYGLLFSERTLLFMMLFPMKAKHFVWVLAGVEFLTSVYSGRGGLPAAAHLSGMVAGMGYLLVAARQKIATRQAQEKTARKRAWTSLMDKVRSKKKSHLKLVIDNEKEWERKGKSDDKGGPKPPTWH